MDRYKFEPLYYLDNIRSVEKDGPEFERGRIKIINPHGTAGIVTLWTKPWEVWDRLKDASPELFDPSSSPLVTLTSLYGNGLPQMLVNLANNPQIEYLGVTGNTTKSVPSDKYLFNYLEQGIELSDGEEMGKIRGTEQMIDSQLDNGLFSHLMAERFALSDLEGLVDFVKQDPKQDYER